MAEVQRLNIDVSTYLKLKSEGSVRIIKVNGIAQYAQKRFNNTTGAPEPVLVTLNREEVIAQRVALAGLLEALDAVIADIDAAVEV